MTMTMYGDYTARPYSSFSRLLEDFYARKNEVTRIRQKSADLRHIVQTILERDVHKYDLQQKQIRMLLSECHEQLLCAFKSGCVKTS